MAPRPRARSRSLALAACAALAAGCTFPEDRGLARPAAAPATRFEQRDVRVGGVRLRYLDEAAAPGAPAGALPVLILPGHTARLEDYDGLVAPLARGRRVLLADLPGKGYSEKPVRRYDFAYYEESAAGFLDALGVPRVDLVGGSLGANLALRLASRFPARVRRVVGWAPGSLTEAHPALGRAIRVLGRFPPVVQLALRIQSRFWFSARYAGREAALRDKFAYFGEVMGPGFAAMYVGMAADSIGTSLLPLAPGIEQPTLLLVGSLDEGGGVQAGIRRLDERLPHGSLRVIPDAGHSLVSEALEPLVAASEAFLDAP